MSYAKLRGRIREIYGTQEAFAKAIGLSKVALSMRLNNKTDWSSREMVKAKEALKIKDSEIIAYFFTPSVQNSELN